MSADGPMPIGAQPRGWRQHNAGCDQAHQRD